MGFFSWIADLTHDDDGNPDGGYVEATPDDDVINYTTHRPDDIVEDDDDIAGKCYDDIYED